MSLNLSLTQNYQANAKLLATIYFCHTLWPHKLKQLILRRLTMDNFARGYTLVSAVISPPVHVHAMTKDSKY